MRFATALCLEAETVTEKAPCYMRSSQGSWTSFSDPEDRLLDPAISQRSAYEWKPLVQVKLRPEMGRCVLRRKDLVETGIPELWNEESGSSGTVSNSAMIRHLRSFTS